MGCIDYIMGFAGYYLVQVPLGECKMLECAKAKRFVPTKRLPPSNHFAYALTLMAGAK